MKVRVNGEVKYVEVDSLYKVKEAKDMAYCPVCFSVMVPKGDNFHECHECGVFKDLLRAEFIGGNIEM